ncbi:MAG TPA: response regulator [Chloroflexota bacterium]|nr:response regulator [Chloroflexota bacterium]
MVQRPVLIASAARDPFVSELVKILQSEGWEVLALHTVGAVQKAVSCRQPALVVLDTMLPGGDALSLCRQWKSDPATAEIPVFFFSVLMARDRCVEAGADGFMLKPTEQEQLLEQLRQLLNSRVTKLHRRAK